MKIFDCFMFYDEELLLDIRLNILNKYVDFFIIVESEYFHNGKKRQLKFDINKFKKFKDKIIYLIVDEPPPNLLQLIDDESQSKRGEKLILNGMARDYHQREWLIKGIKEANENDLILISDLDEIPNLSEITFSKIKDKIIIFQQNMFYYKLNLLYENFFWYGSRACKKKYLVSPQWLRNIKAKKYSKWRIDLFFSRKKYVDIFFVKNGGWHFTYLKTPEQLHKKLLNFAHHFEFKNSGLNIKDIRKLMDEKRIIYDHNIDQKEYKWSGNKKLKKINRNYLPKYINLNLDKYKDWYDLT